MRMPDPVVMLDRVVKRYGAHAAVDGVSLSVEPGERLALLGHNGAGKTTLMKLVLGLTSPSAGSVRVLGENPVTAAARLRHAIGFQPENVAFHDGMTGWETLRFYARLKSRPKAECAALLERVGLTAAARRRVGTYSKGMRQRLGLAQALLGAPRLMLLDEPTNGLDPELRHAFYEIVRERRDAGVAVVISSHLLTELEERTDRIVILDHGRIVALGTLDELRTGAGLPVRVRVRPTAGGRATLAAALGDLAVTEEDGEALVIVCRPEEKLGVLRRVMATDGVLADVEVEAPGLDDVYAHFTGARADTEATETEAVKVAP